jgi:predicted Ser/Thr protein kinase
VDPERWRHINDVFHAALEHDADARAPFLESACGDDAALRREVESLLRSHAGADDFIETPAYEAGAELLRGSSVEGLSPEAEALIGQQIGPYAIEASLGYGGMGVVYLAEDTRLDRKVAIKVLADHLGRDERSRERLRREAKAAAALSHQGIATVFALEEFDEQLYIVYEYAEGQTLREEMGDGPLTGARLLDTALAIGRALQAAHVLGIVHRDLKPENIIRTRDGGIKILDFGLASFQESPAAKAGSGEEEIRLTLPGMLLGTPSYMAPEQLKGRDVDFRADLFSFGVLLYEMASDIHPFEGDDPASTIGRILEVEPRDLSEQARADLPEIESLLRTLLHKLPEERYAQTSELVADLERMAGTESAKASGERPAAGERGTSSASSGPDARDGAGFGAVVAPRHDAFWWWRFHQLAIAVVYGVTLYGLWWAKEWAVGGRRELPGAVLFYAGVALVIVAGSLRIHLAFAARYYPGELRRQLRRATPWIRPAEFFYAAFLFGGAALIGRGDSFVSALLVAAASGMLVFSRLIEPTTARAAFPDHEDNDRP